MSRTGTANPKFGVFAEGSRAARGELPKFEMLWLELSKRCGGDQDAIRVYDFHKGQIEALKYEPGKQPKGQGVEPLDVLIARMHGDEHFENAVIAFDRWPPNKALPSKPDCLRKEVNFILQAMKRRAILPTFFLNAAGALLEWYETAPRQPRTAGRPPFGPLEFLYMDPMFEGLLACDEPTVLRALGLERRPKDWPRFKTHSRKPDEEILRPAIEAAAARRKESLPDFRTDKHGWALRIIRAATADAKLWKHPIIKRLEKLLVYSAPKTPAPRSAPRRPPAKQRSR
jgi:hypothetical protein